MGWKEKLKEKKLVLMFFFTLGYMLFFTIVSIINLNYEFLYYTLIMSVLLFVVIQVHKKIQLPAELIFGLAVVGALHIFGGNLTVSGTRLYDYWIIPGWFKYDNLVHFIGSFVAAAVAYNLLSPYLDQRLRTHAIFGSLLLILLAMGIGAFNEIFELIAVVYFDAAEKVGDYMNNALDLVFNLLGSVAFCIRVYLTTTL